MGNRSKPFFFIATLIVVLMFLVGFRSGQQVEKRNKEIDFIISLTPPATATPTVTPTMPPLTFKTYLHKGCGSQFLIPNTLTKTEETSNSARFEEYDEVKLALSCAKANPFTKALQEHKEATGVARLSPSTGRRTYFYVANELLELIEASSKFVNAP